MPAYRGPAARAERRARSAAVDDPAVVLAAALRYLETRSRSVEEVRRHLEGAGYRATLVAGTVERLLELGLLDDPAFAVAWIASRDRSRPRGAAALRRELAVRGVAEPVIAAALASRGEAGEIGGPAVSRTGRSSPDADADAADRLLARRSASLLRVADPRLRRSRAYGLLARNGFDSTVAAEAVTRAMGAGGMLAAGAGTGSGIGWDDAQAEDPEADPLDG